MVLTSAALSALKDGAVFSSGMFGTSVSDGSSWAPAHVAPGHGGLMFPAPDHDAGQHHHNDAPVGEHGGGGGGHEDNDAEAEHEDEHEEHEEHEDEHEEHEAEHEDEHEEPEEHEVGEENNEGVGEDCSTVIVTCGEVFTGSLADAGRNASRTSNANQTRTQIREITRTCHRNNISSGATTTGKSLPPSKETCRAAEQAEVVVDPLDLAQDKQLTNLIGLLSAAFPRIVEMRESSFDAAFEGRGADGECRRVGRSSSSSTSARSTSASNKISRSSTTRKWKSKEEEIQLGDEKHLPELLLDCKGRKTSPTGANLPPGSSQPSLSEVDSFTFEEAALLLSRVHKLADEDDGTVTNAEDDDQLQENPEIQLNR
ncbi:unnamed protein product [Amoebophrya sp. A25]|nr:unnamed protein product [Amoebophrya sp. A25]|eukprot:GSA25T00024451001.1